MALIAVRCFSLFFTALALVPTTAHLLALPNKVGLARNDYLIVQQTYRGWALLGLIVIAALLSTLVLAIMIRGPRAEFVSAGMAFLCLAGAQVVFWRFTFPANQQTNNWTTLPENWTTLRAQWEYSHAAGTALSLIALVALIYSVLVAPERSQAAI